MTTTPPTAKARTRIGLMVFVVMLAALACSPPSTPPTSPPRPPIADGGHAPCRVVQIYSLDPELAGRFTSEERTCTVQRDSIECALDDESTCVAEADIVRAELQAD